MSNYGKPFSCRPLVAALLAATLLAACDISASLSEAELFQRAEDAYFRGDLRASQIDLKSILQENPDSVGARWLLGQVYLGIGDGAAAEKELRRAISLGMQSEVVFPVLGRALLLQQRYDDLLSDIRVVNTMDGTQKAQVLTLYGQAHLATNRMDEAEQVLQAALRADPQAVKPRVHLAQLWRQRGQAEQAQAYLDEALELAPDDPDVLMTKADLAFDRQDYAESETAYRQVVEQRGDFVAPKLGLVWSLIAQGKLDPAVEQLQPVLKRAPDHPLANYLRALAAYQAEQFETAETYAGKVLELTEQAHPPSLLIAGASHLATNETQQALVLLERLVNLAPGNVDARRLLSVAQSRSGRSREAAETLRPLVADTDNVQLLKMAGSALVQSGDFQGGKQYLLKAMEQGGQGGDDPVMLAMLGLSRLSTDEREQGLKDLEQASESENGVMAAEIALVAEHLRDKNIDKALEVARRIQQKYPDSSNGFTLEGMILAGSGRLDEAEAIFKKVLEGAPADVNAITSLAKIARLRDNPGQARQYLEDGLSNNPENPRLLASLAELEKNQGNLLDAAEALNRMVEAQPEALQPRLDLGRLYLQLGEPLVTVSLAAEGLQRHRDDPKLLRLMGSGQIGAGQLEAAADTFERLIRVQGDSVKAHYDLALIHERRQDWSGMYRALQQADAIEPDKPAILYGQARALLGLDRRDEAEDLLRRLVEANPDNPSYTETLGEMLMRGGNHQEAMDLLSRTFERKKTNFVLNKLATAQWQSGDREGAVARLEGWLESYPKDELSLRTASDMYLQLGRWEQARDVQHKLLENAADNPIVLNNLAWAELQLGNPGTALQHAEKALEQAPRSASVLDTAAQVYLALDRTEDAVARFREAMEQAPQRGEIQYRLAQALIRQGNPDEARQVLRRLLDSGLMFDEQDAARALLQELDG